MWIVLAIVSALCLGFYDINKKRALMQYKVVDVLTYSLLLGAAILLIPLLYSRLCTDMLGLPCPESLYVPTVPLRVHGFILIKSLLVLSSWICAYTSVRYLPLSLVSPMQATRPMWTLIGAVTIFSEQLGGWQWAGIILALASIMAMATWANDEKRIPLGESEEVRGKRVSWPVVALVLSILLGACSGLYDKHMMRHYDHNAVQVWYIVYQAAMMVIVKWLSDRRTASKEKLPSDEVSKSSRRAIALIAVFLIISDYVYFLALTHPESMIAVVSMIRRGGTIIPFFYGLVVLREPQPVRKTICLTGIIAGLLCLCLGSIL